MRTALPALAVSATLCALVSGCGSGSGSGGVERSDPPTSAAVAPTSSTGLPAASGPKILTIGDSITEGRLYYRVSLQQNLAKAGCKFDFVGSVKDAVVDPSGTLDPDNEGHAGWRADQLADRAREWTAAATPDVVIVHVGTNDFYQTQDVPSTVADTRRLVAEVRSAAPTATILLAQIIPGGGIEKIVNEYGTALGALADGERVVLVDQRPDFEPERDTLDGAHPNDAGSAKVARRFADALIPRLGAACASR